MDFIKEFINNNTDKYEFKYSTVGEYYDAVTKDFKAGGFELPIYHEDFLPL